MSAVAAGEVEDGRADGVQARFGRQQAAQLRANIFELQLAPDRRDDTRELAFPIGCILEVRVAQHGKAGRRDTCLQEQGQEPALPGGRVSGLCEQPLELGPLAGQPRRRQHQDRMAAVGDGAFHVDQARHADVE